MRLEIVLAAALLVSAPAIGALAPPRTGPTADAVVEGDAVHATDLDAALDRLADVAGADRLDADVDDELTPRQEAALASIVQATADSIERRRDASPSHDREVLVDATRDLIATVQVHLPALRSIDTPTATTGEPDVDLPPWLAIDLGGDTTYEFDYLLKIDAGGDDTHLDSAGGATGGCFVPCPETSITVDAEGADLYDTGDPAELDRSAAYQGAARGYLAVGVLVDGAGPDTYRVTGNLSRSSPADVSRLSQGAAAAMAAGALVDLGGDDLYETGYTDIPPIDDDRQCGATPCDHWIGAQGTTFQRQGTVDPGWSLLLDRDGDDVYRADIGDYPAQGVLHHPQNLFDTVLEPGLASLIDDGGSDLYEGGHPDNADGVQRVQLKGLGVEAFLDSG